MKTDTNTLPARLREFNRWRRCDEDMEQPHPADIGAMIDAAADRLEQLEKQLAAERALADRLAGCMAHLANYDWFIDGTESHSVVCALPPNQVREALAAWKEARSDP
jgi:hypothetical protein